MNMRRTHLMFLNLIIVSVLTAVWLMPLMAAELTDVIDAADGDDPFDITATLSYKRTGKDALIKRENKYNKADNALTERIKEVNYKRVTHELIPQLRLGLWRDLELFIEAPITLTDTQDIGLADGLKQSTLSPNLVNINDSQLTPTRAGFGDMLFKFRFAPISHERDESRGEWVLELGYRAPTGEVRAYNNEGVGRGVHELVLGTAFSRRYGRVEPYATFSLALPLAGSFDSAFKQYKGAQDYILPGARSDFRFGIEFIPYEAPKQGSKFFINVEIGLGYQASGRDYSEMFDALARTANVCNANVNDCAVYNPDALDNNGRPENFDGITTVQGFNKVRGQLGLGFYATEHFKLTAYFGVAHNTSHFISGAILGKDTNAAERGIQRPAENPQQKAEHNPVYVEAIDELGNRLYVEQTLLLDFRINLAVMF